MSWAAAVVAAAACGGWLLALLLALSMRRRLSLLADAEHELRGAAAALGLAADRVARTGATIGFSSVVRLQLDRMAAGLEDLAAARARRGGGRATSLGHADMDAGRLAQVLGNLIANATEHGVGSVNVKTSRPAGAVRIEIRNQDRPRELTDASAARAEGRGRGLAIAERAARELGGRLSVESRGGETRAELELPAPGGGETRAEPELPAPGGAETRAEPELPAPGGGETRAELELPAPGGGGETRAELELPAPGVGQTRAELKRLAPGGEGAEPTRGAIGAGPAAAPARRSTRAA